MKELSPQAKLNDDTFATTEYAKGDYVVFTVDFNDDDDYYICEMMAPETVTGDVTRVQNENVSKDTYIRLDNEDTKYYYTNTTTHMAYDVTEDNDSQHPTLNEEYILYMTPADYVLGFKPTAESVDQYLYIMDSDENLRDWNAKVVLPDATQPKVDLDDELDNVAMPSIPSCAMALLPAISATASIGSVTTAAMSRLPILLPVVRLWPTRSWICPTWTS